MKEIKMPKTKMIKGIRADYSDAYFMVRDGFVYQRLYMYSDVAKRIVDCVKR